MMSAIVISFVLMSLEFGTGNAGIPEEQAFYTMARNRFATSNRDQLLYIWHHDCHRRCFYQIEEHFEISCTYDPYIARPRRSLPEIINRTQKISSNQPKEKSNITSLEVLKSSSSAMSPFLTNRQAKSFFRNKRSGDAPLQRNRRGIMHECCFSKACSWEEYAEYCHRTRRTTTAMDNSCSYS